MNDMPVPVFKKIMKDKFSELIKEYYRVQDEEYEKLRLEEVGCETKEKFIELANNPLGK